MSEQRWIDLDGAVNVRDLGGLATTDGGATRFGSVFRGDNLQALTRADVRRLVADIGLRHVVDLRSDAEVVLEGPGPLTEVAEVTIHHLSLFAEGGMFTDVEADTGPTVNVDAVLPWQGRTDDEGAHESDRSVNHYLGYLRDRPDSILSALRVLAHGTGAALIHCAAGKDRTGVVSAFALDVVGVTRKATIADYAQTGDRLERILARLRASETYSADLDSRPADSHLPHRRTMERFLATVDERFGGPAGWLARHGWTAKDTEALYARLRG